MWCGIITVFPEMLAALTDFGIPRRAIASGLLTVETWGLREFADMPHQRVDDRPYGGGPGMVLLPEPCAKAIAAARASAPGPAKVVYASPCGKPFTQAVARTWAKSATPRIFLAGRYEGVDQRVLDTHVDETYSLGDYVLSGGELAIMSMLDASIRWLPGALGHSESAQQDAFSKENEGLLDCPHYTRPENWRGIGVPEVLLSGDHAAIARWRKEQALALTKAKRPDLLDFKE